ncbi:MAG TPA: hypothetical protein VK636_14920 [Gemmatimonadaceae bacterium]|nr:hypothetical protein [Gemmatimonadaceae bacterium]
MRRIALIVSLLTVAAAAACADISAPHNDGPCKSGYESSSGWVCSDSV